MADQGHKKSKAMIGGMSGKFPQSENLQEFWENLESGKDMIGPTRWPKGLYNLPPRTGCFKNLHQFDAEFFELMDLEECEESNELLRFLLEVIYECLVDSGLKLKTFQSERTGCYIAYSFSDTDAIQTSLDIEASKINSGPSILSSVVRHFGLTGPAITIDTACSSSLSVLNRAVRDLTQKQCRYAIVAGTSIIDNPNASLRFLRLNMLSPNGTSNVFDKSANGYVRADGMAAILLARNNEDLARVYASIVNVGVNCDGYKVEGITYPSSKSQANLLTSLYHDISTNQIAYVEAHGTGTQAGDKNEAQSLGTVLSEGRSSPLLVGSVKSNMGHGEAVAGLAGIIKCLLSIHHGRIPGNLNYRIPNPEIPQLHNGQIKVVDKTIDLPDGLIGVNSFGFGGVNGHVVLEPYKKKHGCKKDHHVSIVTFTARTKSVMEDVLTFIKNNCNYHCLMNFINNSQMSSELRNPFRAFLNLSTLKEGFEVHENLEEDRGSACLLIDIPWFKAPISLAPNQLKMLKKISKDDAWLNDLNENQPSCKIKLALGLIKALKTCNIEHDRVIGSGLGEVVAACVDGCIDEEQCLQITSLIADCITQCDKHYPFYELHISLNMAYQLGGKVKIVSINKADEVIVMVTAEGKDKINQILKNIHMKGGVYKFIGNFPPVFSPLFQPFIKDLQEKLDSVFTQTRLKSSKFLAGSCYLPHSDKDLPNCKVDAKYFTTMLMKQCNIHRLMESLPDNTTIVDVCTVSDCSHSNNNLNLEQHSRVHCSPGTLINSLGHLHCKGFEIDLKCVNDQCDGLPLDCKTPPICNLIGWDHSVKHKVFDWFYYSAQVKDENEEREEYSFSVDHGSLIESLLIYHVWQAALRKSGIEENKSFKMTFYGGDPKILCSGLSSVADVFILPGSKQFALSACDCKSGNCAHIVYGVFEISDEIELPIIPSLDVDINQNVSKSDGDDGECIDTEVMWEDNWLEFFDSVLDLSLLDEANISSVYIDIPRHRKEVSDCPNVFTVYETSSGICKAGGLAIQFDMGREMLNEGTSIEMNPDFEIPNTMIDALSVCEISHGKRCLAYSGQTVDKEHISGLVAIEDGRYGHKSLKLESKLLHLEVLFPYSLSCYIVHDILDLKSGQSVLFLPPLVGVNLIMIWMAVSLKCQVFVASSPEESPKFLLELYPDIILVPINNPMFIIKRKTQGKGCNSCISLADPLYSRYVPLDRVSEWLSDHGKFVIMGNALAHGNSMGMAIFLRNVTVTVCEPIQAIVKLLQHSPQQMKDMAKGLDDPEFRKLSSIIHKEFCYPITRGFEFSVPINLSCLIDLAEEPGLKVENLNIALTPADVKQLRELQDLLSFTPQEYSLAQDVTAQVTNNVSRDEKFNNAFGESRFDPSDLRTPSKLCSPCSVNQTPRPEAHIRIISISQTPYNSAALITTPTDLRVTSTPRLTVEIKVTPAQLEESGIATELLNRSDYNLTPLSSRFDRRSSFGWGSPALSRIQGRSRSSFSEMDKNELSLNNSGYLKKDKPRMKSLTVNTNIVDLVIVGPPRTPRTPQTTELLKGRFIPTIVSLNDKKGTTPLFLVHPITGGIDIFKPLAESCEFPVYGIQRTSNTPESSVYSIASYYMNAIEMFDSDGPYFLGGHSFGGLLAIEIAFQLQAKGKKIKTMVLLDGSIDYVLCQKQIIYKLPEDLDASSISKSDQFEVGCLLWFMSLYGPVKQRSVVYKTLLGLESQHSRIEMAVDFLMGNFVASSSPAKTKWIMTKHKVMAQQKCSKDGFYKTAQEIVRLSREEKAREFLLACKQADIYDAGQKQVESDIHLLRIKSTMGIDLDSDYGLSKHCSGKVHVTFCDGSHEGFLKKEKVSMVSDYLNNLVDKSC